jgi:hypothetical protein
MSAAVVSPGHSEYPWRFDRKTREMINPEIKRPMTIELAQKHADQVKP